MYNKLQQSTIYLFDANIIEKLRIKKKREKIRLDVPQSVSLLFHFLMSLENNYIK